MRIQKSIKFDIQKAQNVPSKIYNRDNVENDQNQRNWVDVWQSSEEDAG